MAEWERSGEGVGCLEGHGEYNRSTQVKDKDGMGPQLVRVQQKLLCIGISIMESVTRSESMQHSWMTCRGSRSAGLEGKGWPAA